MRQEAQGYSDIDGFVCEDCILDPELKRFHGSVSANGVCDFCGALDVRVSGSNEIQTRIMDCLLLDYEDIQQADAPYVSREGGYQIAFEPAADIIRENCWRAVSDPFLDALADAVGITDWCDRDWTILSQSERLRYGWEKFCHTVRHRLRFSFAWASGDEDVGHPDYIDPRGVLETLAEFIDTHHLIKTIQVGQALFRVRLHKSDAYDTLDELGAPPHQYAKANRMSPAGITMFYGASIIDTALAETWIEATSVKASIGTFRLKRAIRVIDFDELPEVPSYWNPDLRSSRHALGFLHDFAEELSKPVERNSLVDLPYASTQIVSEFLTKGRYPSSDYDDPNGVNYPVHGLVFSSSRAEGQNLALNFVNVCDKDLGFQQDEFIELAATEFRSLSKGPRMLCWLTNWFKSHILRRNR